jgi:HK97 family phage prohead protease
MALKYHFDKNTRPETRSIGKREVRYLPVKELRTEQDADGKRYFTGYAAVFNSLSQDLGGFKERIKPGAFARAIAEQQEVHHLINHDENFLLGNTAAGTTVLTEDSKGLRFKTLAGSRSYEKDLLESIDRGDIRTCSFAFSASPEGQSWSEERDGKRKQAIRDLLDVDLFDVSIVGRPAYLETSAEISVRSLFPDGVPAEVRSHLKKNEVRNADCQCSCESCVAGNCANCTNTECDDPNCDPNAQMHAKRTDPGDTTKPDAENKPSGVCNCQCDACKAASNCSACTNKDCEDENCVHAERSLKRGEQRGRLAFESRQGYKSELRSMGVKDGVLELMCYGDIGDSWYSNGITAQNFKNQIDTAPAHTSLRLRMNSPGGDAFEGVCIGNYLKSTGKPIEVCVDGLAASAASVIAMCGDKIHMAPNAMMMVHNASTMDYGYASDLRKTADVLDKISTSIAQTYVTRTGKSLDYVQGLMDAETWMSAADCVKDGFATDVAAPGEEDPDSDDMLNSIRSSNRLAEYRNVPERFRRDAAAEQAADLEQAELLRLRVALALAL